MLKIKKTEVIDVVVGQYNNGYWYATAPSVPWLAAEGDSREQVMQTIQSIAPAVMRGCLCLDVPLKLDWLVLESGQ